VSTACLSVHPSQFQDTAYSWTGQHRFECSKGQPFNTKSNTSRITAYCWHTTVVASALCDEKIVKSRGSSQLKPRLNTKDIFTNQRRTIFVMPDVKDQTLHKIHIIFVLIFVSRFETNKFLCFKRLGLWNKYSKQQLHYEKGMNGYITLLCKREKVYHAAHTKVFTRLLPISIWILMQENDRTLENIFFYLIHCYGNFSEVNIGKLQTYSKLQQIFWDGLAGYFLTQGRNDI